MMVMARWFPQTAARQSLLAAAIALCWQSVAIAQSQVQTPVQTPAQSRPQASTPAAAPGDFPVRIIPGALSPGVPDGEVACRGQRNDDRPALRCLIRFVSPIDVLSVRVVDPSRKLEWTPVFHPFDPAEDNSAIFVLLDRRRGVLPAETRDLDEIIAHLRGQQQLAVAGYANDLSLVQAFTTNRAAARSALARVQPGGSASELYRHALEAIRQLQAVSAPRKILLLASSGRSDDTAYTAEQIESAAKQANVHIVSLGYVERSADSPQLQTLERMSNQTDGEYLRADVRRPLSKNARERLLAHYNSGGTLEANAPTRDVPNRLDVTLRHPGNRTTAFVAELTASSPTAADQTSRDAMTRISADDSVAGGFSRWLANPWWIAALGGGVAVVLALVGWLVARSLRARKSHPGIGERVSARGEALREGGARGVKPWNWRRSSRTRRRQDRAARSHAARTGGAGSRLARVQLPPGPRRHPQEAHHHRPPSGQRHRH